MIFCTQDVGDQEHIYVFSDDTVDQAVGLEEYLTEIQQPQDKQLLWIGPSVGVFGQAGKHLFNLKVNQEQKD